MVSLAGALDASIRAVYPHIEGVAIGKRADRSTWTVRYTQEPSAAERASVQAAVDAFTAEPDMM